MSQADFEKAKQRLAQAKRDVLWAINVLENAAQNLSEYELSLEEVVKLGYQFQQDLEEIRTTLEQKHYLEKKVVISPQARPSIEAEVSRGVVSLPKVVGEIPPFDDPDEENNVGGSRSIY